MDPEVVAQFNSLQQTGNYIPSGSSGSTGTSSSSSASPATSSFNPPSSHVKNSSSMSLPMVNAPTTSNQAAVDALFAQMGTRDGNLGLLGP